VIAVYCILFFMVFFLLILFTKDKMVRDYVYILYCLLFLFLSFFQRGSPDYVNYERIYNNTYERFVEPGYSIFVNIFFLMGLSFETFWSIQAIIINFMLFYCIRKLSDDKLLSVYIFSSYYFILKNLVQVRNMLAILFIMIAVIYNESRKKKKSAILCIIGNTFHFSTAPIDFILNIKTNILVIIFIFSGIFIIIPIQEILNVTNLFSLGYEEINHYIAYLNFNTYMGRTFFHIFRTFVIVFWGLSKYKKMNSKTIILFNIYIVGSIFKFLFCQMGELSIRFSETFYCFEILLLPNLMMISRNRNIIKVILVVYSFINIYTITKNAGNFMEMYRMFNYE
jgi:hypothetical protein